MPESTPVTLATLAEKLGATAFGHGETQVTGVAHPRFITAPTQMVLALEPEVVQFLPHLPVETALIPEGIALPEHHGLKGYVVVPRPRYALATLLDIFDKPVFVEPGVHPTAVIHPSAQVDSSAQVGAYVTVGPQSSIGAGVRLLPQVTIGAGVKIEENCLLHAGVRVGDRVQIGKRVVIQPNAVIGADGFSFVTPEQGSIESAKASGGKIEAENTDIVRINSIGSVVIEDDVEIGACTTIDRATLTDTLIKRGTKIDNLVQIGHNNTVGENCLIVSQVGIAGSCQVGDRVVIAGQTGLADHIKIGNDAILMARSGVMNDIPEKTVVGGAPAIPRREMFETIAYTSKLRSMYLDVKSLKKQLADLESQLNTHHHEHVENAVEERVPS